MLKICDNQEIPKYKYSRQYIEFICDCGNIKSIMWKNYTTNHTKSCGSCRSSKYQYNNIVGKEFGRLSLDASVVARDKITKHTKLLWRCNCGNTKPIAVGSVVNNLTKSCGCLLKTKWKNKHKKYPTLVKNLWLLDNNKLINDGLPQQWSKGSNILCWFVCECGGTYQLRFNKWTKQSTCRQCHYINANDISHKYEKLTIVDDLKDKINPYSIITVKCDCGNIRQIQLKLLIDKKQTSCGSCNLMNIDWWLSKKFGHLHVIELTTPIKTHSEHKLLCTCSCGNKKRISAKHLASGLTKTCGNCSAKAHRWWQGKNKLSIGGTSSKKGKYSLKYLTKYFKGSYLVPLHLVDVLRSPINMQCTLCGNIFTTRLDWVYHSKIISCGCIGFRRSRINSVLGEKLIDMGCSVAYEKKVGNYSYDLLINNKLLCECHGLRYHSTELRSSRKIDRLKYKNAITHDYKYAMVYEDEINGDIITRLLAVRAGIDLSTITLRPQTLIIKQVQNKELNELYDRCHYIGKVSASLNFAIVYKDKIVAGISFRNPIRQNTPGIELCRMCVDYNYKIRGLWSWFFAHTLIVGQIVSYSDNRLFDGHVYKKLGFYNVGFIKQDYYWVMKHKRHHKSKLRKPKGCIITETKLRESQGYHKIYDLGKTKWVNEMAIIDVEREK